MAARDETPPGGTGQEMTAMNTTAYRNQLICACSGFIFMALFLGGFWVIAGFVPPPPPGNTAEATAKFFQHNTIKIRIGLWVTMVGCALVASWTVAVSAQLKRIVGAEVLAQLQLILGSLLTIEFLIPVMMWQAAAFRPDGDPQITARYNDMAWLIFLGLVSTVILQEIVIGIAILQDSGDRPVFPRWIGYLSFLTATLTIPGGLIVFFKTGPFAWNGIMAWWVLLVAFCIWMISFTTALIQAIKREYAETHVAVAELATPPLR
jgi:hypothetical protein